MVELISSFFRAKSAPASPASRVEALAREIMPTLVISAHTATHEARIREAFRLARIWHAESVTSVEVK
jgi:hypothetical protein